MKTLTRYPLRQAYWSVREHSARWRQSRYWTNLARGLYLHAEAQVRPVVTVGGVRLARNVGLTTPVLRALADQTYEAPEAHIVRHAIDGDDVVLELGTGLGYLSALCASLIGSDRVHTYEANPALAPVIERNHRLNGVAPSRHTVMLADGEGSVAFYVMKSFWSSSTVRRSDDATEVMVPKRSFNDEIRRVGATFLIVDIEGGEVDLVKHACLDGVQKVCIELHPAVIGAPATREVEQFFVSQGFDEDPVASDDEHKLYVRARA